MPLLRFSSGAEPASMIQLVLLSLVAAIGFRDQFEAKAING
jgi:hypothetical protein